MARLGDYAVYISRGKSPKYVEWSDIRVISQACIYWDGINIQKVKYHDENSPYEKAILQNGDVLINSTGTGTLGRAAVFTSDEKGTYIADSHVTILRCKENLDPIYLAYFLSCQNTQNVVYNKCVNGSTNQIELSKEKFASLQVTFPDLPIQRRIAATLDKVSEGIAVCRQMLADLDVLVKSQFVEMFGDITEQVNIGFYINALSAGKSLAGEESCENKVLKTGAVTYDYFDGTQVKNLPTDYIPQPDHIVKKGDIIISRMNTAELVGAAAYVWEAPVNTYLPDRLWRAELNDNCNPIFVWQMLIHPTTKEQIRREASGTSGSMKNISKAGLLAIKVKKVPLSLQNTFAEFIEQIDKSKFAVQKALDEIQLLFDSLMQKYFG